MEALRLSEHSTRTLSLPEGATAYLASECRDVLSIEMTGPGTFRIRTRQHVGVFFGPGVELRIEPKCSLGALFHLLSHCYGLVRLRHELAGYEPSSNLFEFFVTLLLDQVEALARQGIRRDYRAQRDELRAVRGRIDAARAMTTLYRPEPRIPCEFEELTEDVLDNQIIRFTLERIRQWPIGSQLVRARARRLRQMFSRVSLVRVTARDIERREYDRLTRAYQPIHGLCRLLLDACGLEAGAGAHRARGFAVNMNTLFERFVLARLTALATPPLSFSGQVSGWLDRGRFVAIRPDIVMSWGSRPVLVADTKYKLTASEQVANADVYQALAYTRALGVRTAYLLYPAWEHEPRRLAVVDGANQVVIDTIPLAGQPAELDAAMVRVLAQMRADGVSSGDSLASTRRAEPALASG